MTTGRINQVATALAIRGRPGAGERAAAACAARRPLSRPGRRRCTGCRRVDESAGDGRAATPAKGAARARAFVVERKPRGPRPRPSRCARDPPPCDGGRSARRGGAPVGARPACAPSEAAAAGAFRARASSSCVARGGGRGEAPALRLSGGSRARRDCGDSRAQFERNTLAASRVRGRPRGTVRRE